MFQNHIIAVIIPVLNEEKAIGRVLADVPAWVDDIIVVDNGSTDNTAARASEAGARVVREPRRGYGQACLAGMAALDYPDVVVFLDGDYSDHPDEMAQLVEPIVRGDVEFVIGSRMQHRSARRALTRKGPSATGSSPTTLPLIEMPSSRETSNPRSRWPEGSVWPCNSATR